MTNHGEQHWSAIKSILDTSKQPYVLHYVLKDNN